MRPGPWWRAQNSCVDNAKLIKLSDKAHRNWFNLNCVANAHGGVLPDLETIAIKLRISSSRAANAIAELVEKRLFDRLEDGSYVPHDWNEWQFKTDAFDATNADRQKKYRAKQRDELKELNALRHNVRLPLRNGVTDVTAKRPETETETEDRIVEARASVFSEGSKALASAFWKALGFENVLQIPPEFAGVDWRAVEWERAGWTADLIDTEARRIGADKPLSYHEKVFATAFAKRQAPLPIVEVKQVETLTVKSHGTSQNRSSGSLTDSIRRELAECERSESADLALPASPLLRISN